MTTPSRTRRRVLALAWPTILSNLTVPLLGLVDTAVVGHLPGPTPLGAVAVGALIFSFLYWGFGFLRMGTTGFAAQARGAGDALEIRASLARPALLGAVIGLALVALQPVIAWVAFPLIDASAEVEAQARAYFHARIWAAPAALVNYAILGWLLGLQRPGLALALQVTANVANVALDLAFVYGLGLGVAGVGAGSAVAQGLAMGVGLLLVRRVLRAHRARLSWPVVLDRARLAALWRANADLFLRSLSLIAAFGWFTVQGAAQGDVTLAANAVLLQFQTGMSFALDGFAHAAEALVGERLGRRDPAGLAAVVSAVTHLSAALAVVFAGGYWVAGPTIIAALTDVAPVRAAAETYLPWVVASPLVSVWCYQLDGIFVGATDTRAMRDSMVVSLLVYLGVGYAAVALWGNHGLWLALLVFMASRAATLGARYPRLARRAATRPRAAPTT